MWLLRCSCLHLCCTSKATGLTAQAASCTRAKMTRATCHDSCCPTIVRDSPVNALWPATGPGSRRSGQPCSATRGASPAPCRAGARQRTSLRSLAGKQLGRKTASGCGEVQVLCIGGCALHTAAQQSGAAPGARRTAVNALQVRRCSGYALPRPRRLLLQLAGRHRQRRQNWPGQRGPGLSPGPGLGRGRRHCRRRLARLLYLAGARRFAGSPPGPRRCGHCRRRASRWRLWLALKSRLRVAAQPARRGLHSSLCAVRRRRCREHRGLAFLPGLHGRSSAQRRALKGPGSDALQEHVRCKPFTKAAAVHRL
jgi:hypothetical protein